MVQIKTILKGQNHKEYIVTLKIPKILKCCDEEL